MAVYKGNGRYSGKVGSVVFCNWKDIDYIRSVPDPVKRKPSQKEKTNRERLKLANRVMQSLGEVLRIGFRATPGRGTPLNAALSDIMKNAITRDPENITADYPRLRIAAGLLQGPQNVKAVREADDITFTRDDNSSLGDASPSDHSLLVAVSEDGRFFFSDKEFTRNHCQFSLTINGYDATTQHWHCYLAFLRSNKKDTSTSVYAGQV
ncbi:DUF6266 family protein [Marinilabilia rubra]|uniref:Uncharacterized protein n=1 Tax=Marinilabilia rubra TaxID=2162893 RepID=A0A2U2BA51_9BACT|nr:DUF6266 family protein [Marinilabilia rubra]PWD99950.1 hypothetical protein DDZ16_08675 [Marinilabilia rubra]